MNADERRKLIADRKELTGRQAKLWCKDTWKFFEVYRVPVEGLLLNVDNRRFAAERKLHEENLGHSLDPENSPDDEQSVVAILLDMSQQVDGNRVKGKPSKDTESLKTDWLSRKQETPFWVRPDGTVRNGNRRLAMVYRLRADHGTEGNEWVEAVILDPREINEDDLFEMEQREQLTENLKVRYTDINLLLALRDAAVGRGIDWTDPESIERVAGELQQAAGGDKAYALIQLYAIKYMDAYLADSKKPGQYQMVLRQVERFRDVGKNMVRMETDYPDESPDMLRLAFAAIRAGNRHGDIRALRRMFIEDRPRFDSLLKEIEKEEEAWEQATDTQLENPDLSIIDVEADDEAEGEEPPGPVVPAYPVSRVNERIKNSIDGLVASKSLSVRSSLYQVWSRLETLSAADVLKAIDDDVEGDVRALFERIVKWSKDADGTVGA